jgi:hypothetical protein
VTPGWERLAALGGVVAVVLWVIGALVIGENPDEAEEVLNRFQDESGRILGGGLTFLIGTLFFFIFLGALRLRLLSAEGPAGFLTAIAFAAGVAVAIFLLGMPGGEMSAALAEEDLDPSSALAMSNIADIFFIGAELSAALFVAATGLLILRYGPMPRWHAWVSFVLALWLLIAPIGWAGLLFGFPIWVLLTSALLWVGGERQPATAAPGEPLG